MVTAGLAAQAPCLGSDDPQRGPGPYGCHPGSGNNNIPRSLLQGPSPSPWTSVLQKGGCSIQGPVEEPGHRPENLALLALSLPINKPDEILCQMVWPDFCFGKSGQEGTVESLGPWQGCLPERSSWAGGQRTVGGQPAPDTTTGPRDPSRKRSRI